MDPGNLKSVFGSRIKNADFVTRDTTLELDMDLDYEFDATKPWPVELRNGFALVILGDIIEHVESGPAQVMLREAWRVAPKLCITVPNDPRLGPGWNSDGSRAPENEWCWYPGSFHVQQVTEDKLRAWLQDTGWKVVDWRTVHYHFVPEGYFVMAERQG